jgi:hypothetical protein
VTVFDGRLSGSEATKQIDAGEEKCMKNSEYHQERIKRY